jgi:hypothetical protein
MMQRINVFLIIGGLIGVCLIGGLLGMAVFNKPTLWQNPPLYPGAQQVRVQDYGTARRMPSGYFVVKQITFTTPDSRDQVFGFYRQQLAPNGSLGGPSSLWTNLPDRLVGSWQPLLLLPWVQEPILVVWPHPASSGTVVELLQAMDPD